MKLTIARFVLGVGVWPLAAAAQPPAPPPAPPEVASTFLNAAGEPFADYRAERAPVADRVYFDVDSASISADASVVLEQQSRWLQRNPAIRVAVEGYADARGSRAYNMALGARRAEAVRARLVALGVQRERIDTVSYGSDRPVDVGMSEAAHRRNRSAQTVILQSAPQN